MTGRPDVPQVGCAAALFVAGAALGGAALYFSTRLGDPAAIAAFGTTQDTPEERARLIRTLILFSGLGGAIFVAAGVGRLLGGGAKPRSITLQVSPTLMPSIGRVWPVPYYDPAYALANAPGCAAMTAVNLGVLALLMTVWTIHPVGLALYGIGMVLGLWAMLGLARTYLAARRVRIEVASATNEARRGGAVSIAFRVDGRAHMKADAIRAGLAGFRADREARRIRTLKLTWVDLAADVDLAPGKSTEFRAEFRIPDDATPTSEQVCWMLVAAVSLPGWPDLEVVEEVKVGW